MLLWAPLVKSSTNQDGKTPCPCCSSTCPCQPALLSSSRLSKQRGFEYPSMGITQGKKEMVCVMHKPPFSSQPPTAWEDLQIFDYAQPHTTQNRRDQKRHRSKTCSETKGPKLTQIHTSPQHTYKYR